LSRLVVAPIVEGHGEDNAIRLLVQRIWTELLGGEFVQVIKPIRWPRNRLVQHSELKRAIDLAALKLRSAALSDPAMILILLDADRDPPCTLGPDLLRQARESRPDIDVSCVVANVEYETWFVAAAASLGEFLQLPSVSELPLQPEAARLGKAWVQRRFRGLKYSETLDQPAMTQAMDLGLCRERSPSFDKLCRELHARLGLSG
jgi:hypothetical protein